MHAMRAPAARDTLLINGGYINRLPPSSSPPFNKSPFLVFIIYLLFDLACPFTCRFLCEVDWIKVFTCILQILLRSYLFSYPIMTIIMYYYYCTITITIMMM